MWGSYTHSFKITKSHLYFICNHLQFYSFSLIKHLYLKFRNPRLEFSYLYGYTPRKKGSIRSLLSLLLPLSGSRMDFSATMEEDRNVKTERSFDVEDEKRARSFRDEDYNNRRVFLRSYPLHWAEDQVDDDEAEATQGILDVSSKRGKKITALKQRVLYVLRWSEGKVLILKNFKNKVSFYLVTCHPFGLKPSSSLLSV